MSNTEETKLSTLRLPVRVAKEIKVIAARQDTTVTAIMTDLLEQYIEESK